MSKIEIKMLGHFEILVDGNAVLEKLKQSKKTRQFLEYLILKWEQGATHEELLGTLWTEKYSTNPATALRTLLHRYRCMVEESGIKELANSVLTSRGSYRWNTDLACEIDLFQLEKLCREAAAGGLSQKERAKRYQRIAELYTGPMLPESARESWVAQKSAYYHDLYLDSMFDYIELLKKEEDYRRIVQVCRRALDVDMFDNRLQTELTMALLKTGKNHEALSEYQSMTSAAGEGGESFRTMYEAILQAEEKSDNDMESIQNLLNEGEEPEGAYICDYAIFREVYCIQRRMIERYCSTLYVALVTVSNGEKKMESMLISSIMKRLLELMQQNLRKGDTVTRYSATQYVVLLPAVTYDTGSQVMERVKRSFYDEYVNTSAVLTYKLRPLSVGTGERE